MYKVKDAAEALGVCKRTIYTYVEEGLLTPINKRTDSYLFTDENILELKQAHKLKDNELSPYDVSLYTGYSYSYIMKLIQQKKIESKKIRFKNREIFVIDKKQLDRIGKKINCTNYATIDRKYYLFSKYIDRDTKTCGRIIQIIDNDILFEFGSRIIGRGELEESNFEILYPLKHKADIRARGYFIIESNMSENLLKFVDIAYSQVGPNNMMIEDENLKIKVYIKPVTIVCDKNMEKWLDTVIATGNTEKVKGKLKLKSNSEKVSIYFPEYRKKQIQIIAEKNNMSLENLISNIVKSYLRRNEQ